MPLPSEAMLCLPPIEFLPYHSGGHLREEYHRRCDKLPLFWGAFCNKYSIYAKKNGTKKDARCLRSSHPAHPARRQQDAATDDFRGGELVGRRSATAHFGSGERGVIARNSAVVNPDTIPLTITAIVELQLRDERAMTVDAAKTIFRNAPEVQQCYYVTGGTSFILIIVTSDMRTYEALTRQLFATNDLVASYRTLIALDKVKTGTGIFIPE